MKIANKILSWVLATWIIIVTILGLACLTKMLIFNLFENEEIHTEEYTVSANDTLWSIACEYSKGDVREYVYNLRKLNNIDDCIIYPGQVIQIIK